MEIEINDTPAVNDDLVQIKCDRLAHRPTVRCRIRATSACPVDSVVVLTNPDGRLRFTGTADRTRTVTVPGNGSWVSFQVAGETGSAAIGDAVIEAHCHTATGPVKATKPMTVFWFDEARMDVATPGTYGINGGRFEPSGGNAADLSAQARIRPAGVNCAAPQVAELQIGIMQNEQPGITGEYTWDTPRITWDVGVAAGTQVVVPSVMRRTFTLPRIANDSAPTVNPLYDRPGRDETLDENSLKSPIGCPGAATATSHDSPSEPLPGPLRIQASTAARAVVGSVTYTLRSVRTRGSFITWAVVFNTRTNAMCALRERPWILDVISTGPAPQRASAQADRAPSMDPVLAPTNNDLANDRANRSDGPVGAATTTFRK